MEMHRVALTVAVCNVYKQNRMIVFNSCLFHLKIDNVLHAEFRCWHFNMVHTCTRTHIGQHHLQAEMLNIRSKLFVLTTAAWILVCAIDGDGEGDAIDWSHLLE